MKWYVLGLRRIEIPAAGGRLVRLEDKPIADITKADVEQVRERWPRRRAAAYEGAVGADRALKRLRHLMNWAVRQGYLEATPFHRGGLAVVQFAAERPRTRRLAADEEGRLLHAATTPLIKALILAALETGCRIGELLGLRVRNVKADQNVLLLPAEITKTNEARDVPISRRLKAVLEMRRQAPDRSDLGPDAFVFGDEVGGPVKSIRTAWEATCKAAGITDLHFHDLRREAASRLRESCAPDHVVAAWLGHANMMTTTRYLKTTRSVLQHYLTLVEDRNLSHTIRTNGPSGHTAVTPSEAREVGANSSGLLH
jgi:integrase